MSQQNRRYEVSPRGLLSQAETRWGQISLQQLEILLALVSEGQVSAAAHVLGYPSLSSFLYHLRRLEELVGAPLVQRKRRHVVLTQAGHSVHEAAIEVLDRISEARGEVAAAVRGRRRRLRVGTGRSLMNALRDAYNLFLERRPDVEFDLFIYARPSEMIEHLAQDRLDICLATTPLSAPGVTCEMVAIEDVLLVCHDANRIGRPGADVPSLIAQNTFFVREPGNEIRRSYEDLTARLRVAPREVVEIPSMTGIKKRVEAGLGLAVLPRSSVASELAHGILRSVNTKGLRLLRQIYSQHLDVYPPSEEAHMLFGCFSELLDPHG